MKFAPDLPTISSSGLKAILSALAQMGIDIERVKREAGLAQFDLDDTDLRVSCNYATRCYRSGQIIYGADDFGLQHGLKYQPFTLGVVGHLLATASSGLDALQGFERYQSSFGEGLKLTLSDTSSPESSGGVICAHLSVHPSMEEKVDDALIDSFFVALVNCARLLTGDNEALLSVQLRRRQDRFAEQYAQVFACPVEYGQARDQIILRRASLERPLLSSNEALFNLLEAQLKNMISGLSQSSDFVQTVRKEVLKCIDGHKVDVSRIASRLNLSERSLQRRLKESGQTFQTVLDEVRTEFCKQQLRLKSMSVDELAYVLAYSEPSTFRKTFKRWTGHTPTEFRALSHRSY